MCESVYAKVFARYAKMMVNPCRGGRTCRHVDINICSGFLLSGSTFHVVFTCPRFAVEILNLFQVGRRIIDFAPAAAVSPPSALAVPVLTPDSASVVLASPLTAMIVGAAEL